MPKKLFLFLLLLFSLISCKQELLPSPLSNGNENAPQFTSRNVLSPQNVIASHGQVRSVTLSWDAVKNAKAYYIYSADTFFDHFEKVGETTKETTITLNENSGVTKAYYVSAVDYNGKESQSFLTTGSSISIPIITEIEKNEDDGIYTLNWYMSNCYEDTYANDIFYDILVYENNSTKETFSISQIEGKQTSYDITDLKPSTEYGFIIKAYKKGTTKAEPSDKEPIETGHKIVPDAAKDFSVSKGKSTSQIDISFTLPDFVEAPLKDGSYDKENPIYFTLKKKLENSQEDFTTVYDYIGFNAASKYKKGKSIVLDGGYEPGKLVTITDTIQKEERGKKYVYVLQSFTDVKNNVENNNITSLKTSLTQQETGWAISNASFKVKSENSINEDTNTITQIDVSFNFTFENFDLPYTYYLTRTRLSIEDAQTPVENEAVVKKTDDLSILQNYINTFTDPENENGYYIYNFYIAQKIDNASEYELPDAQYIYEKVENQTKVTVTHDATSIPKIENFEIDDGYSDKFILSWDNIENATYTLSWKGKIGESESEVKSIGPFTKDDYSVVNTSIENKSGTIITDIKINNGKLYLTHSATSGDVRTYTLTADTGLSTSKENENYYYTLGTAKPVMHNISYDKITVVWPKVQKAKENDDISQTYTISANYTGQSKSLITEENTIIGETSDGNIKCVITKLEGYNDANLSGKPISFRVTTNGKDNNSTTATTTVSTLGPATLNVQKDSDTFKDKIKLSWNKIPFANGYLICRVLKNNENRFETENANVMFISPENKVYANGEVIKSANVEVQGEKIIFSDNFEYTSKQEAQFDSFKNDQIKLTWGLPFSYTVVPVLNEDDVSFEVDKANQKIITKVTQDDEFTYSNLNDTVSSTYGYGLNVKASKATSSNTVTVNWDKPYNAQKKTAKVYRRKNANEKWNNIASLSGTENSYDVSCGENDTNTYDYAVVYNNSEFDKTYIEELESNFENETEELLCKGYTLSIPQGFVQARHESGYKEQFSWEGSLYDFNERKVGPDFYEIQILNKNKATGWVPIATISLENESKVAQTTEEIKAQTAVKLNNSASYQATFEPIFDEKNITLGQMQVLRDYKHYYRLVAVRNVGGVRVESAADMHKNTDGSEEVIYAIREITDEELVRCVSLIIGDALYKSGIPYKTVSGSSSKTVNEGNGTFTITGSPNSAFNYWNKVNWAFSNYRAKFSNGTSSLYTEQLLSGFTLSSLTSEKKSGSDENKLYYLPPLTISLNHETNLPSYQKSFTYEFGQETGKANIYYTIKVKNNSSPILQKENVSIEEFYSWFPFELGKAHQNGSSALNTDYKIYTSPWWETQGGN